MELATLKGTEKQVAWAGDIRESLIAAHAAQLDTDREQLARYEAAGNERHVARKRSVIANTEIVFRALTLIPHAEWWIAQRNRNANNLWEAVNGIAYAGWLASHVYSALPNTDCCAAARTEAQAIWPEYNGE